MDSVKWWLSQRPTVTSFQWKPEEDPFASRKVMLSTCVGYLVVVFLLHGWMKRRLKPVELGPLPVLHNLILAVGSLVMLLGSIQSAALELPHWSWYFCFPRGTQTVGAPYFWGYVYYLSKYYELIDTVILVLKKRPLTFLHVFHHFAVVIMAFYWLDHTMSLQVVALWTNTSVHVVMYTYYFLCSVGHHPAWKKLVTNMQIVQFIFSYIVSSLTLTFHFRGEGCQGMTSWMCCAGFNAVLLMLFFNFRSRQYKSRVRSGVNGSRKDL